MCKPFPYMVICDFDGTVTTEDTFWGLVNAVCSKEVIAQTMQRVYDGETILIDACLALIESIPATDLHKVDAYIESMRIRPGFDEFVGYLNEIEVPLIVLSGGLDYTVQGKLAPYREGIHAFYSAVLDTSKEYLTVLSPCMEPYSFLDKSTVLPQLNADVFIGIGDGVTDLTIAKTCRHMFARDTLLQHMQENGLPYIGWNDFYDVIGYMKNSIFV
ncbi:MAG: HAD family hydrolase [Bacillota bacterium]